MGIVVDIVFFNVSYSSCTPGILKKIIKPTVIKSQKILEGGRAWGKGEVAQPFI